LTVQLIAQRIQDPNSLVRALELSPGEPIMPNPMSANQRLFAMLFGSPISGRLHSMKLRAFLVGNLTLLIAVCGLITSNNLVSAQLAGQLESFGLVQKAITILGPSTASTAFQNAGHTYVEQGMILTALSCCASDPTFSSVTDTSSPLYVGKNTLFHHIDGGLIMLARVDEGTFNMQSVDVAQLPGFDQFGNPVLYGPFAVTFTGIRKNGKIVTTVFTAHNFPQLDTFTFTGFNELIAVQWFNGGAPGIPDHQFAKIVVQVKKSLLP
jgi:hypothetical protein